MQEILQIFESGTTPFALAFCEKPTPVPVTGAYDEQKEMWLGLNSESGANLTLTLTLGDDRDQD